jgi:RNA polymerase sigma-70 factor (ECF subfamily)
VDPDCELVEQAREGSQEAFAGLVRRYQAVILNLARALTASDVDADDLAQDVFVKVYKGLEGFRGESTFRTWIYAVALNVIRGHMARRSFLDWFCRKERVEAADALDHLAAPDDFERATERRDAIDRALRRLPPDFRVAVTLRDIQGLEYKEIADVLRVPIGTVMSRIARGRARLRPMLSTLVGGEPGDAEPGPRRKGER